MSTLDWFVLSFTLFAIVAYGSWKTRKNKNLNSYLKGDNQEKWFTIGLSIMATQASAITFLSTPGQAFESGMGFIQFYFGLPLAMIIISVFILPIYYRLKVYTAYQYLEQRFDYKTRALTASLFLISRGLAAGITIYAPAIILSSLLHWNLQLTCIIIGVLVIFYTVSGGSKAVSLTQKWQMGIIMIGMFIAFYYVLQSFPENIGFTDGMYIAGNLDKLNIIDFSVDPKSRYTIWSGLTGGLFLFLSYFGTDQSQVQRYLGGKTLRESRQGLMFNGFLKIPMQFFILLIGVMVFVSYQFNKPPIVFNDSITEISLEDNTELQQIESEYTLIFEEKRDKLLADSPNNEEIKNLQTKQNELRDIYKGKISELDPNYVPKDTDYVFLTFVMNFLPKGLIGLLLAVIFSAAMSSTAGELNALASTTTIDFYKKFIPSENQDKKDLLMSKLFTVGWGILAIIIALVAGLFDNLIQLVNILGSIFYGTILGIFLVAFFFKKVSAKPVFIAGLIGQSCILVLHFLNVYEIVDLGYLWYNAIGSFIVVLIALLLQQVSASKIEEF